MKRLLMMISAALCLCACNLIGNLLHDGEVVATVGDHKLYLSELSGFIPVSASSQDSARLAESYIEAWKRDMRFVDLAEKELSKEEKDVTAELEEYKRTLLRYRYEQKYINQRLDTAITPSQIEEYHGAHKDMFRVKEPIVKCKLALIPEKSQHLAALKRMMSAESNAGDVLVSDSLAYAYAAKYTDFGGRWVTPSELASEAGVEASAIKSSLHSGFVQEKGQEGNIILVYVDEMVKSGDVAPVDYCKDRIRDIILSNRKQALSAALEREVDNSNKE